jgi:hypothetical protein
MFASESDCRVGAYNKLSTKVPAKLSAHRFSSLITVT